MRIRMFMAIAVLCVVFSTHALSQSSNATVGGTVSDATGALIPGVSVTATNTGTGIVVAVITNEAGAYNFPSLQTGTYRVSAELPGFQTQTYNDVALGGAQQVRLNFTLQVGSVAQAVEVTVSADTLIATTSASVGTVLPEYRVRELPLGGRNVMDLLGTTGGTGPTESLLDGNFAGGRLSAVNTTRDGFVVSDGRFNSGAFSSTYVSPDLVEEVRIITAPVDAEAGRGAGQVQMVTRSGTNQFRGSLFWQNRNSALDAANWFTNFNNRKKDYENRNNWGGRLGGPIVRNKTFFFVLVEGQRDLIRQDFVGNVLTAPARQGTFRFFPGADNGNTISLRPTVDSNGNAVRPASATGDLQQFSVFNRDAFRPGYDPTGFIQNLILSRMPVANDFTIGDGLNTAGHRFTRRMYGLDIVDGQGGDQTNRDQFNTRIDHNFNSNNKFSVIYTQERNIGGSIQAGVMEWPGGYDGMSNRWPLLLSTSLVSTISPTVINELRVGYKRVKQANWTPYYVGRDSEDDSTLTEKAKEAFALLPQKNGIPFVPVSTIYPQNFMNWVVGPGAPRWHISPQTTYADTISWNLGAHSFKAGAELRRMSSSSGGDTNQTPRANIGAGGVPIQNIDNVAIPGLTGNNQTLARTLLAELSGSVDRILQGYDLRDSKNPVFLHWGEGAKLKLRGWHASEFAWFFKDTWKTSSNVTLNYGVHWEWFGVPYEERGLAGSPVGGSAALCGISCGSLSTVEFVGKNSPNPDKKLYNNDLNNFAPSFGLSWNVPWLGKDKTVLRAGYGWSFPGGSLKQTSTYVNFVSGGLPGTFGGFSNTGWTYTQAGYLSLGNLSLPIPKQFAPLAASPLDGSRQDSIMAYDTNRQDPYIQNINLELQREMGQDWTLSIAYVGTKGTRLWAGIPLNGVNINAALPGGQTFFDAFNVTRSGGNAPLFDQMLRGMNIPGAGVVNGTTLTGSAALRAFVSTRGIIANGNVAGLADFLNRNSAVTGKGGGFVRNSGLFPENFFVLNPQFSEATLHSNPSNSTYHSTQIQATKRLSKGFTNQITYTLGRALGETDNDFISLTPRDPNNRSFDKALLAFHRTHNVTTNGTFELPFGPNRPFLSGAPGFVQRLVERWQLGAIFSWTSGAPLTITAPLSTVYQIATNMTPNIAGDFPKSSGKVTKVANGVTLFPGILQINDPSIAGVSSANALNGSFTNKAITDSQGQLLLTNPAPGQIGTLGLRWVEGPTRVGFDANLIKRVRLSETREFEFRLDALNILNRPNFDIPTVANLSINSASFGRITTATGSRRFIVNARLNF